MSRLRVFLADLTHVTVGPASEMMPLNIGYVASYAIRQLGEQLDIKLFKYIDDLEAAIADNPPDVLAASNYEWCCNANRAMFSILEKKKPEAIRVMGGPNFPHTLDLQEDFLANFPLVDAYVYVEGEMGFVAILEKILELGCLSNARAYFRTTPVPGCRQIGYDRKLLMPAPAALRIKDLDVIPSPYLTGLLDPFFDETLIPMIQSNRGCPFRCTYCADGNSVVNKVYAFSPERVIAEVEYIANHVRSNVHNLQIADLNFGMYKDDEVIAQGISEIQKNKKYPLFIDVSTGKNSKNRVISVLKTLNGTMRLVLSVQSMTPDVLKNVKRDNLRLEDILGLKDSIVEANLPTISEVILSLPGETLEMYYETIAKLLDADVDAVTAYSLIMINGSEMNTLEERNKWGFKTKYRVLPRSFTRLSNGEKVIEVEEVATATNTLSFDEYIEGRGMALLLRWFNNYGIKPLTYYLAEHNVRVIDWLRSIQSSLNEESIRYPALASYYSDFKKDTTQELFDSREALQEHYNDDKNFERLVQGLDGKNLVRHYEVMAFANAMGELIDCAFHFARVFLRDSFEQEQLGEIENFIRAQCHMVFADDRLSIVPKIALKHDIKAWVDAGNRKPLADFALGDSVVFGFPINQHQYDIVEDLLQQFGRTASGLAKVVIRIGPRSLWRKPQLLV
jgi:radical SAM superfamily enzyme YgiQ (UPF0313 family)